MRWTAWIGLDWIGSNNDGVTVLTQQWLAQSRVAVLEEVFGRLQKTSSDGAHVTCYSRLF